jgi:long-subunit acyl-CoA synthetase (AMP-forming)
VAREEWTPENEMMTATLKIRRNKMAQAYTDKIKEKAKRNQPIIWE